MPRQRQWVYKGIVDWNVYPHGSMESASNVVVLLQSRTASQNLRQPELTNSTLHVSNLSL